MGGNGCGGSDAPVGTCTGSGILFGNETCCLDYDAVCTGEYKGRVTAARWGCYNTENTVFDFGTSRCCVEKTQAELDAAAASGGVSSGGGPSTTGGAQGTGSSTGSTQAGNGSSTGAPLTKPLAANGTCASPNACRSTKCNTGETTASGSCPNSGVCCAPAGGTTPPAGGAAAGGAVSGGSITVQIANPLQYDTVEGILGQVMSTLRNIVVILALVFLVIGGLMYITSAGNDKRISAAKACITAALVGIAIVMVAPSFLKEIGSVLGWSEASSMAAPTLSEIARKVLNFLLGIVGVIAIIMFLVGSVMYLTSAGDDKRAGTAKDIVKYAIIGLIVAFSALVLVAQLASFFV